MGILALGFLLGFVAGGCVVGVWLRRGRPHPSAISTPSTLASPARQEGGIGASLLASMLSEADTLDKLRQDLRVKCLFDESKVSTAIEFERERNPTADEEELIKAAIYRWERDNR